jgi:hypothetical protein
MMEEENKKNNTRDSNVVPHRREKAKEQHEGFHRRWLQFIPK